MKPAQILLKLSAETAASDDRQHPVLRQLPVQLRTMSSLDDFMEL